ncbi:MAG: FAD-dependent oxidoreductase, partial [Desulfobacterales bacterium]
YMDMRTFDKSFQRYRDEAETMHGIRFERGRVHSVVPDTSSGDLLLRSVDIAGQSREASFDMVILSVGQRPAEGMPELLDMLAIEQNSWGFGQIEPFSLTRTPQSGILLGGSFAGLKDIGDSVTQASAAALNASRVIHSAGGSLALESPPAAPVADVMREQPRILVIVCSCGERLAQWADPQEVTQHLKADPLVERVEFLEQICTAAGWERLVELVQTGQPNRLLIGACLPYVYKRKLQELGGQVGLDPALMEVVDLNSVWTPPKAESSDKQFIYQGIISKLEMGLAKVKWANPEVVATIPTTQRALVVGGGIAGMTAALAIADHGFEVDLVEQTKNLGGNLMWLQKSLEGHSTQPLLEENCALVEKHPKISVRTESRVIYTEGEVGNFETTLEGPDNIAHTLKHGVTILATGGTEAVTTSYGYETSPAIITQKEFEQQLSDDSIDPQQLNSVVMIQCVDSREEPRNYCSRVCCANALKQALYLKEHHPEMAIYILYRDLMAYGFSETYYTQARKANVMFIQYRVDEKPVVQAATDGVEVTVFEPIIGQHLKIKSDLLVLATGIVPNLPPELVEMCGAALDQDGFFQEAESKWRPVDSLKEGVFACGLSHSPRNIAESITTAEAAAQRALRILARERVPAGKVVASVRHSLCSLCERCIEACPYGARAIDHDHEMVRVNPVMCQGCGTCAAVCPNSASILEGFRGQQMFEMIDVAIG